MDLRYLGDAADAAADQKEEEPQFVEEKDYYSVEDYVLVKSDVDASDQRFWVAQVMNICRRHVAPDIDYPDPEDEDGASIWLKVWWSKAEQEFGKYVREFHTLDNGTKTRSLSWISVDDVICRLEGGLNQDNTIKKYSNRKKKMEYLIKKVCGELEGDGKLCYTVLKDDVNVAIAQVFLKCAVELKNESGVYRGTIVDYVQPEDQNYDQRIHFKVQFDDNDLEDVEIPFADLQDMLIQ